MTFQDKSMPMPMPLLMPMLPTAQRLIAGESETNPCQQSYTNQHSNPDAGSHTREQFWFDCGILSCRSFQQGEPPQCAWQRRQRQIKLGPSASATTPKFGNGSKKPLRRAHDSPGGKTWFSLSKASAACQEGRLNFSALRTAVRVPQQHASQRPSTICMCTHMLVCAELTSIVAGV